MNAPFEPRIDFTAWPSWPLCWDRWKATPFAIDCARFIRDEAKGRDEGVYWAAQGVIDTHGSDEAIGYLEGEFAEAEDHQLGPDDRYWRDSEIARSHGMGEYQ
tara:strand:+ start:4609 stop:4917 length:309 start_codon:yes stop_codon:yes gene_type:complete